MLFLRAIVFCLIIFFCLENTKARADDDYQDPGQIARSLNEKIKKNSATQNNLQNNQVQNNDQKNRNSNTKYYLVPINKANNNNSASDNDSDVGTTSYPVYDPDADNSYSGGTPFDIDEEYYKYPLYFSQ